MPLRSPRDCWTRERDESPGYQDQSARPPLGLKRRGRVCEGKVPGTHHWTAFLRLRQEQHIRPHRRAAVHENERLDTRRVPRGNERRHQAAHVVPHEHELVEGQLVHGRDDVVRIRFNRVRPELGRVTPSTEAQRHGVVVLAQQRHQLGEGAPGVQPSVKQHDGQRLDALGRLLSFVPQGPENWLLWLLLLLLLLFGALSCLVSCARACRSDTHLSPPTRSLGILWAR
mmetsp:Transcript_4112/g.15884  ORF Transcript_4112/g.15884 Transcript_4112/m.15884 type:complete len:228 (+) Transcript_4112:799-1482(+)